MKQIARLSGVGRRIFVNVGKRLPGTLEEWVSSVIGTAIADYKVCLSGCDWRADHVECLLIEAKPRNIMVYQIGGGLRKVASHLLAYDRHFRK